MLISRKDLFDYSSADRVEDRDVIRGDAVLIFDVIERSYDWRIVVRE